MRVRLYLELKYFKTMIYNCHDINTIVLLYITKTTVYYLIQRHVWCSPEIGSELASLSSSDPILRKYGQGDDSAGMAYNIFFNSNIGLSCRIYYLTLKHVSKLLLYMTLDYL